MSSLGIFDKETKTYKKVADLSKPAAIDSAMSDTSTNAVQNKVVKSYVDTRTTFDAGMSNTSTNAVQNKVVKSYVDNSIVGISDMTGSTATQNGSHGFVPAPKMGDEKKALLGNGTWGKVDVIFTYSTKNEYDTAVANNEIPDGATVIKAYDD